MHRKKIAALLLCLVGLMALSGCMGDVTDDENNTTGNVGTTTQPPATTLTPGTTTQPPATTVEGHENGDVTNQMLTKIRGLDGITEANALVMGNTAWIWIEHTGTNGDGMKNMVETTVKDSFDTITDVRIITDETIVGRLEEISDNLKNNGKIDDYRDELDKIK